MCNPVTTAWPESLLARGVADGFEWEVTNNGIGYRCGYVRIPPGHPWHGKGYDDVSADVHGGLTFAEADAHCGKGGADDAWWVGFDAAHYGDAADPSLPPREGRSLHYPDIGYGTVRSTAYVTSECQRLASQARAAEEGLSGG